jgi:hypothetical protein
VRNDSESNGIRSEEILSAVMLSLRRQRVISGSLIGRRYSRKKEMPMPYFAGRDVFLAVRQLLF